MFLMTLLVRRIPGTLIILFFLNKNRYKIADKIECSLHFGAGIRPAFPGKNLYYIIILEPKYKKIIHLTIHFKNCEYFKSRKKYRAT